mmetsp:Transcript_21577/g.32107  ORF Transcript_21577/g.32107 Transcript_21577/m.32107 type:complete len:616 (-) Transcript_21577:73-1920(-)
MQSHWIEIRNIPFWMDDGSLTLLIFDKAMEKKRNALKELISCQIVTNSRTGKSKGFGYASLASKNAAEKIIKKLDGIQFKKRTLNVRMSDARHHHTAKVSASKTSVAPLDVSLEDCMKAIEEETKFWEHTVEVMRKKPEVIPKKKIKASASLLLKSYTHISKELPSRLESKRKRLIQVTEKMLTMFCEVRKMVKRSQNGDKDCKSLRFVTQSLDSTIDIIYDATRRLSIIFPNHSGEMLKIFRIYEQYETEQVEREIPNKKSDQEVKVTSESISNQIFSLWQKEKLDDDMRSLREAGLAKIKDLIFKMFPKVECHVFGSYAMDLSTNSSDVDILLTSRLSMKRKRETDQNNVFKRSRMESSTLNQVEDSKILTGKCETSISQHETSQPVNISQISSQPRPIDTLPFIAKKFQGLGMKFIRTYLSPRVPVLRASFKSKVDFEVSVQDRKNLEKTRVFVEEFKKYPIAIPMIFALKRWGKARKVSSLKYQTLNSFALSLLVLYFLRTRGKSAATNEMQESSKYIPLAEFFEHFSRVSILAFDCPIGLDVAKKTFLEDLKSWVASTEDIGLRIFDPVDMKDNPARNVTAASLRRFRRELIRGRILLRQGISFDALCSD